RAHRLTNEIGRRHARDAETVRGLGRDRRLPGPGRSAHEEEQRLFESLQRIEPPEPAYGPSGLLVADQLDCELAETVEIERHGASLHEIPVGTARDQIRALRIEARHHERTGHEPLGERHLVAERQRESVTALPHDANLAMPSSRSS